MSNTPIIEYGRIQLRRGQAGETGVPQLASGELGWAIDSQQLFIGNGSISEGAPYIGNTRILTYNDIIAYTGTISVTGSPVGGQITKFSGSNSITNATSGIDYAPATTSTSVLKGNGSGGFNVAVPGTDYAGITSNNSFNKSQNVLPVRNTSATGTIIPDFSQSNVFFYTLVGNLTIATGTNATDGQVVDFKFKQGAGGPYSLTVSNQYKVSGGAPSLSTATGALDVMRLVFDGQDGVFVGTFAPNAI